MFENIEKPQPDKLLELMGKFRQDPRKHKVDLLLGVYKDEAGTVPIMKAVAVAQARHLECETTKNYVGIPGDREFRDLVPPLLLGKDHPAIAAGRTGCVQTVAGSGALRVACDIIKMIRPKGRIWFSTPSWPNHVPIARKAGLAVVTYPYFRARDRGLDFDAMMTHLREESRPGDTIVLQAGCHNPTGVDLDLTQWQAVAELIDECSLLPLIDNAYQGFDSGLEEDMAGVRHIAAQCPELLIASSCSKNFGLYRERVGTLTFTAADSDTVDRVTELAKSVIRPNYSMPPSHGARIVVRVLQDEDLRTMWAQELDAIRTRIADMRAALRAALEDRQVDLDCRFIVEQRGMFSYTGIMPDMVTWLREEQGIYMAADGRINVAGLNAQNIDVVADGFAAALRHTARS